LIYFEKLLAAEIAKIFFVPYEIGSFNTVFRTAHK